MYRRKLYSLLFRKLSKFIITRKKSRIYSLPQCLCLRLQWKLSKKLALIDIKERERIGEVLPVSERYTRMRKHYLEKNAQ